MAGIDGGAGTVFALNPRTGSEKVVYAFHGPGDGFFPAAGLINIGGTLFGTTEQGGKPMPPGCSCGKVFRLNPATGIEKTLHTFQGGSDGVIPSAGLVNVGGMLYGTTQYGYSVSSGGTVFSVDPRTGAERVVHDFQAPGDGGLPTAGLIDVGGLLFGTTYGGGILGPGACAGAGTVFSVDPTSGAERVVYTFRGGSDGCNPAAGLLNVGGTLYGTTTGGGTGTVPGNGCLDYGCGTVFSLNPATGTEQVLHAFQGGIDGAYPEAGLIDVAGTLYGTTVGGSHGTVFALTP